MNLFHRKREIAKNERSLQDRLTELDPSYLEKLTASFDLLQQNAQSVASEANNATVFLKEELENTRHRFFTVIDNMVDLVIIKNAKSQWLTANKYAQELLQLDIPDFYMKTSEEIAQLGRGNANEYLISSEYDEKAWSTRKSVRYVHSFTDPDGNKRELDMIKTPTFKRNGEPHEIIIVGRDITDIVKAHQLNKAVTNALHGSSDVILIIDKDGLITFCNARFLDVFGYDCTEEVENHPISIIKSGEHTDAFFSELWTQVSSNSPWHGEIINQRKDGSLIRCVTTIVPVMNGLPMPIYYISVMKAIDVS